MPWIADTWHSEQVCRSLPLPWGGGGGGCGVIVSEGVSAKEGVCVLRLSLPLPWGGGGWSEGVSASE